MQGLLLVDKPPGWTSFDVVNYIRQTVAKYLKVRPKTVKVGHCGTLDPIATGLLLILIGKEYTKRAAELTKLDKTYEVELKLGYISPSLDTETPPTLYSDKKPSRNELNKALETFKGKISQIPPVYSAIKIDGQRAYNLARAGKEVKLDARVVEIHKITLNDYNYPFVKLILDVSSGTYIRSLVSDLGEKLGTVAIMTALARTKIGNYYLKDAIKIDGSDIELITKNIQTI